MQVNSKRNGGSTPCLNGFYFMSDKAIRALPNYKYSGEDKSKLYEYVLSPLAQWLVENYTPRRIAPNTITLLGLLFMIISYAVYWFHNPTLETNLELPRWIFLYNGFAMLIYQTLDNMDGKHSRKTGSSSPLGMIFDHGCDAINTMFGSANWLIAMGVGPATDPLATWALLIGPMALFYVSTWEEYFTGHLLMPVINGASEGVAIGAVLSISTYFVGVSFWQGTTWYHTVVEPILLPILPTALKSLIPVGGLRNLDIVILAACSGFVQEMAIKTIFVSRKHGLKTLLKSIPMLTLGALTFIIGAYDLDIWVRMPRAFLHLCSGLFVEMVSQLMFDHTTEEKFQPFRWTLLPLVVLTVLVVTGQWEASRMTDDYVMVYMAAIWAFLAVKMRLVIHEICCVLSIWCFDIVTPRNKQFANGSSKHLD